jgi:hypothetical protein
MRKKNDTWLDLVVASAAVFWLTRDLLIILERSFAWQPGNKSQASVKDKRVWVQSLFPSFPMVL